MATAITGESRSGFKRPPAVAGRFYPGDLAELGRSVDRLLRSAPTLHTPEVRGLVVPHAGYPCSGVIAATAYRALADRPRPPSRIFLLGPTHTAVVCGAGLSTADAFETPLGAVAVDQESVQTLAAQEGVFHLADEAHRVEHCLEVQLPFLQRLLPGQAFRIVPILLGEEARAEAIAAAIWAAIRTDQTAVVIATSDLCTSCPYAEAYARDRSLIAAIVAGDEATVSNGDACGIHVLLVHMRLARMAGWRAYRLAYLNSGDTCGPRERVAGYAAIAYTEGDGIALDVQRAQ